MGTLKVCKLCGIEKSLDQFYPGKNACRCIPCHKAKCKAYYEERKRLDGRKRRERNPVIDGIKHCRKCGITKPISEFWDMTPKQKAAHCKPCANAARKIWYLENKDKDKNWKLKREYGITLDRYNEMLNDQNNCCDICGTSFIEKQVNVDHCHATEKVRGLLCSNCNLGIGNLRHDLRIVEAVRKYLIKHG